MNESQVAMTAPLIPNPLPLPSPIGLSPEAVLRVFGGSHLHASCCYWDVRTCRWQCPQPEVSVAEPAGEQ